MKYAVILVLMLLTSGCATSFYGSSKVDGPAECREKCGKWGMELAGMVAMGDYTDGCICRVKGERLSFNQVGNTLLQASAGGAGGSVGVYQLMEDN